MNSVLQCLNATNPLTRYFLDGTFRKHVNKGNAMGMQGRLAEAYSAFLRTLWSGEYSVQSPHMFRDVLIKFAPQFQGTEQHDSQELLSFLLDGLHEDLNLASTANNAFSETQPDISDEKLAEWSWKGYLASNFSVVVSLFQGQLRSKLTCLTCNHVTNK